MEDLCAEVVTPALLAPADDSAVLGAGQWCGLRRQTGQTNTGAQLYRLRELQQRQVIVHSVPVTRKRSVKQVVLLKRQALKT